MRTGRFRNHKHRQGGFKGKRPFSLKKKGFSANKIDVLKFVQKAIPVEEVIYDPQHKFADFQIDGRLKNNIARKGYKEPTPIQDRIIPSILKGKDVVGIANTGTGKTAAFLIPAINKSLSNRRNKTIVIVPTRELAFQIEKEFREFAEGLRLFSVLCIGGTSIGNQLRNIRRDNDFVIGTPGRIKDLVERKALNMSLFKTIVLDEADRMLDMGFINDMKFLMSKLPEDRQALLFSATIPEEIERLARQFLRNPEEVSVKTKESSTNVNQDVIKIKEGDKKVDVLCDLLAQPAFTKVLVFGKTKYGVEKLSKALEKRGFKSESIHGNKTQGKRKGAIDAFKSGQSKILVATDVAARGLDIDNVSHVINYDLPATYEDYVHRIGRTGRGKKRGEALTFI